MTVSSENNLCAHFWIPLYFPRDGLRACLTRSDECAQRSLAAAPRISIFDLPAFLLHSHFFAHFSAFAINNQAEEKKYYF